MREELAEEEAEAAGTTLTPKPRCFSSHTPVSLLQLSLQMFWVPSELGGMFRIPGELNSRFSFLSLSLLLFHFLTHCGGWKQCCYSL